MGLRKLTGQKTYWHLLDARRRPSVYEIASSRLHYYPALGFGAHTPAQPWYERYQSGSAFHGVDLEGFADPRRTTYASYTKLQDQRETYVSGVLETAATEHDAALDDAWVHVLSRVLAPLRFPCHALMMMAGYLSSMAPESRVTIAAAFQVGDEIRRVHGLARRLHALRRSHPGLGEDARALWLGEATWQGLRKLIERTLVIYDWSECFVTLNLALKPTFDHVFGGALAARARAADDHVTAQILGSFELDARWHRAWSTELVKRVLERAPATRDKMQPWLQRYVPELDEALAPLARLIDGGNGATGEAMLAAAQARAGCLGGCGLAH
jgi:toluene monooxygenase system protein E